MEVPPESEENASARPRMVHYYYINYKQFVNVVKYKLDMMRKKLESDDKMASCKQGGGGGPILFCKSVLLYAATKQNVLQVSEM